MSFDVIATFAAILATWWAWENFVRILPRKDGDLVDGFTPQLQSDLRRICRTGRMHCIIALALCALFASHFARSEIMALAGALMLMLLAPSWWNLKFETPRFGRLIRLTRLCVQSGVITSLVALAWVYEYYLAVPLALAMLAHWRTVAALKALVCCSLQERDSLHRHANRLQSELQGRHAFADDTHRKAS